MGMSTLNAPLPDEPIFHHAEPRFAHKLNQLVEAVREIQDHINGDTANADAKADEKLTAAQKRAKAKADAEKEAAAKAEEEAKAAADAEANQ